MVIDGASFGGGVGGGGGIEVPAVRDSERDISSFGSLYRDAGVRFGALAVALSNSMLCYTMKKDVTRESNVYCTYIAQM